MEDSKQQKKRSNYQLQRAEQLDSNPQFKKDIIDVRRQLTLARTKNKFKLLQGAVANILDKYKLPPSWYDFVERYILEDLGLARTPERIKIATLRDQRTLSPEVHIIIDGNATLEDVKDRWKDVKNLQRKLPYKENKKRRGSLYQERDKLAFTLRENGSNITEIISVLKKADFGEYDYFQVKDFIRNYKNRLNK